MTPNEKLVWAAAFANALATHGTGSEQSIGFAADAAARAVTALRYHTRPHSLDSQRMIEEMRRDA